jgi:hypothetical protein
MSVRAGQRLRDQGQAQAEQGADPRRIAWIDAVIARAVASGEPFSANDIREAFPVVSQGLVGSRVDAARKRGEVVFVGFTPSTLTSTRGHRICVWRGKTPAGGRTPATSVAAPGGSESEVGAVPPAGQVAS